jgi:hypothetical protein
MRGWKRLSIIYDSNVVNQMFTGLVISELERKGIEIANNPELRKYNTFAIEESPDNIMPIIEEIRRVKTRLVFIITLSDSTNIIHSLFLEAGAKPGDHVFIMSITSSPNRYYDLFEESYANKVAELALGYI